MRQKQPPLQSSIMDGDFWRGPSGGRRAGRVGAGHAILQDPSIGTHPSPVRSTNPPERTVAVRHGPCKLPFGLRSARPARTPEPAESIVSRRATGPWGDGTVTAPTLRCCLDRHPITSHPRQTTNFRPPLRPVPIRRPPWSPSRRPQPPTQTAVGQSVSVTNRAGKTSTSKPRRQQKRLFLPWLAGRGCLRPLGTASLNLFHGHQVCEVGGSASLLNRVHDAVSTAAFKSRR